MKNILIIFACTIFSTSVLAGGPWPQKKGKGYFKLSEWWTIFDEHFTDTGLKDPNVTTGIFNTTLYTEYGLSDRLTTVVNATLFSRNYMNNLRSSTTNDVLVEGEALNSIGDIDVGFKYGLTRPGSKFPVSASLILGLPTGTVSGGTLNNLQTGDGEFNQMIQIDAGHSFNLGQTIPAYIAAYAGFNNRTNDFSEEIRYGLELGLGLMRQKLWLNTKFNVVESLKNGATAENVSSTSIFANNTEFSSIALEANLYITDKVGISVSAAGAFSGEIIASAPSYSVGIFYDLR